MSSPDDLKIPSHIRLQDVREWIIGSLDLGRFYGQHLKGNETLRQVKNDGWSNRVHCPIHDDQGNPNFFINFRTGNYKCMACPPTQSGGSPFDFWLRTNGFNPDNSNFMKALVAVANIAGIDLKKYFEEHAKEISSGKIPDELHIAQTNLNLKKIEMQKRTSTAEYDRHEKPISKEVVRHFVSLLRAEHIKFLAEKRGLIRKTIEELNIGWCDQISPFKAKVDNEDVWVHGRYSIPVSDREDNCRNLRLYSPLSDPAYKMINYVVDRGKETEKSYGSPGRLLGIHKVIKPEKENIVVVGGEFDWALLNQEFERAGYNSWYAVTSTHGENHFEPEWTDDLHGKRIWFCLDCDEAGKLASIKHCSEIFLPLISSGKFKGVHNATLPLEGTPDDKDISDWFLKRKKTADDLVKFLLSVPEIVAGGIDGDEASVEPISVDDLNTVIRDRRYIDQRVKVRITVASSAEQTYHAVRGCVVESCPLKSHGNCCQSGTDNEVSIPYGHPLFIASCMEREEAVLNRLRQVVCQKELEWRQQQRIRIKPTKKVVMELYYAHQFTERKPLSMESEKGTILEATTQDMSHIQVYLLQTEVPNFIEPKSYTAVGWVRTHPKTSTATLFIENMTPIEENWRKFSVEDKQSREALIYLKEKVTTKEILFDITNGVTFIYDADEILLAVLLVFLSPIGFLFNGTWIRGNVNIIIIGDSGLGKSFTYKRFSNWIEAGYLFEALTGSRTGLLFAVRQKGNDWYVAPGDYVKASHTALAIDEAEDLKIEDTRSLANTIDSGFLEVKKVASGGWPARVRACLLMNAKKRSGESATLSDFTYPAEALAYSYDPMFLRRMDMAIFCMTVPNKESTYNRYIDSAMNMNTPTKITSLQMRALVYWAWTRQPTQIQYTEEAVKKCLEMATALSKIYGAVDRVPLVNPSDFRENLARLSAAYAVLERSFTDDLEGLIVLPKHVEFIAKFIDAIYSSPQCGLRNYSEEMARVNRMDDEEYRKVKKNIEDFIREDATSNVDYFRDTYPTLRLIVYAKTTKQFTLREIIEVTGISMGWLRRRLDHFKCLDLLKDEQRATFMATRKFNLFLMRWRNEGGVEEKLDQARTHLFHQAPPDLNRSRAPSRRSSDDPFEVTDPFLQSQGDENQF